MVLINTYHMKADLFINGETIPSEEGTTRGDPLAMATASEAFHNTGVQIISQGKWYLGAALGTASFIEAYVGLQVEKWVLEIEGLASIASSQPHAAYTAFTHGLSTSWNYVSCTILDIGDLLDPVEKAIIHKHLPALTGRSAVSDLARELFSLPVHLGGLNIANPSKNAASQHNASTHISGPLTALII